MSLPGAMRRGNHLNDQSLIRFLLTVKMTEQTLFKVFMTLADGEKYF